MTDEPMTAAERLRPKLLGVAYRMLGGVADAEDAVQDAYLRYFPHAAAVADPEAWLVTATARRCLDRLRQRKREEYVGPWLPEPVSETWAGAAADPVERADSLSVAFLVLLEALSPAERAAFLLREAFGYDYERIAEVLGRTPENARQIAARAKKRMGTRERRFAPPAGKADELAGRFFAACQAGDVKAVEAMLAADVVLYADGGGKAFAAPRPVAGVRRVANLLAVVGRKLGRVGGLAVTTVNGRPGVVAAVGGRVVQVLTAEPGPDGTAVAAVYVVLNPDKLSRWPAPAAGGPDRPEPREETDDGRPDRLRQAAEGAG